MTSEKRKLFYSLFFPVVFLLVIWLVALAEYIFNVSFAEYGLYPRTAKGAIGIITSPLIHGDLNHLYANSIPLFVLGATLFYFYRSIALRVFILIYLFTNIWVWGMGRESFHIGASGVVYGLAAFLFVSGLLRKEPRLMAISMLVAFLYGSLIWGVFPELFPEKNISWEGHLMGILSGVVFAIYFRDKGPQKRKYSWDFEEEDDDEEDDEPKYWHLPEGMDYKA